MLTKVKPTSIMLETFFCTSPTDYNKAKSKTQMDTLGRLIAEGIANKTVKKATVVEKVKTAIVKPSVKTVKQGYVRVLVNKLSIRSKASWDESAVCGTVKKGEVFTVQKKVKVGESYCIC